VSALFTEEGEAVEGEDDHCRRERLASSDKVKWLAFALGSLSYSFAAEAAHVDALKWRSTPF